MKARVEKVFANLEPKPDVVVLANSVDPHIDGSFFYLFGVPSGLFEGSFAVAHPDGSLDVASSPLEAESAQLAAKHDPHVTVHVVGRNEGIKLLQKLVPGGATVGLNYRELTHSWFNQLTDSLPGAKFVDAGVGIQKARAVKDASEVEKIRMAAEIGSKVGREIPGWLRTGITELELAAQMEYSMNKLGANGSSFSTIVGFGAHSAEPHYSPDGTPLRPGQSIVCDFGARYRRYVCDITRSFRFGPRDDEMKAVHECVEAAQKAALDVLRPGIPGKEVHQAAERVIDASPWKGRFTHGLGHALGLAVHDGGPGLAPNSDDLLEVGMVVTVEPGIYLPGKGGVRIEDDVVLTKNGYEFLTTAPRGYVEVSA
ncbi:MAG: M24 family metallopeptidase [Thermoplasmata archaeon]